VGADLNVSPKRVVFDAATHSATVFVFNQGSEPGSYSLELADQVMMPDGRILKVADAAADPAGAAASQRLASAKGFVIITPRRVSLGPHESQTVRIRALPPADAAPGEYRTHLVVSALPPQDAGLTAEQAAGKADDKTLSVKVIALYSIAIPLIVRQGAPEVSGHLDNVTVSAEGDHSVVAMELVRDGKNSIYGDIDVRVGGAKGAVVGAVTGVGVYPEVDRRSLRLALTRKVAAGEHLTVQWRDQDVKPGSLIAAKDLTGP
jgi:hypothetical protein